MNRDHEAMFISLARLFVRTEDLIALLKWLRTTLGEDEEYRVTKHGWCVTGCATRYADQQFSAAHFLTLVGCTGGQEALIQATRAMRVFGLWNHSSVQLYRGGSKTSYSIDKPLSGQQIVDAIWPETPNEQENTLLWAKREDDSLRTWKEAHLFLLRQCIGPDLKLSVRMNQGPTFAQANRHLTEDYFMNTLRGMLQSYFFPDVYHLALWKLVRSSRGHYWVNCKERARKRAPETHEWMSKEMESGDDSEDEEDFHGPGFKEEQASDPIKHIKTRAGLSQAQQPIDQKLDGNIIKDRPVSTNPQPTLFDPGNSPSLRSHWTAEEEAACIRLMNEIWHDKNKTCTKAGIMERYEECSRRMKSEHGFDHSCHDIYMRWDHILRKNKAEDTKIDPEIIQLPPTMTGQADHPNPDRHDRSEDCMIVKVVSKSNTSGVQSMFRSRHVSGNNNHGPISQRDHNSFGAGNYSYGPDHRNHHTQVTSRIGTAARMPPPLFPHSRGVSKRNSITAGQLTTAAAGSRRMSQDVMMSRAASRNRSLTPWSSSYMTCEPLPSTGVRNSIAGSRARTPKPARNVIASGTSNDNMEISPKAHRQSQSRKS